MKENRAILPQLSILYIVAWCISPPLSYGAIYRIVLLGAIGFLLLWDLRCHGIQLPKYYIGAGCVIAYILLIGFLVGDSIDRRLSVLILFGIIFAMKTIFESDIDQRSFYWIISAVLVLCIVWNICSLQGIAETPNVMRLLAKNSAESEAYAMRGIGGYGYLYSIVLLLPIGVDAILNRANNVIERVIAAVFVFTSFSLVYQSQYFLAAILSLLMVIVYFIAKIKNPLLRFVAQLATIVAFFILYVNSDNVLLWLMEKNEIRSIELKLQSMYEMLVEDGEIQSSEFATRFERYMRDIAAILNRPLLGGFSFSVTGNHSHILDFLAQYGIPFGCAYFYMLWQPLKRIRFKEYAAGFTCMVLCILLLFLNTLAFSFGMVIYIVLPLYYCKIQERGQYG